MDIDHLIETTSWKDILYEVVDSMDVWDVNLSELATRYAGKVAQMGEADFKIPANVVLVSSILLRMKADLVSFSYLDDDTPESEFEPEPEFDEYVDVEYPMPDKSNPIDNGDIPLTIKPRRVPRRRITLVELVAAIQVVLKTKKSTLKRKYTRSKIIIPVERDIGELIDEVYARIVEILDKKKKIIPSKLVKESVISKEDKKDNGNSVTFSELVREEDVVKTFISVLHLTNNQKLKLRQEQIFGEIFISI